MSNLLKKTFLSFSLLHLWFLLLALNVSRCQLITNNTNKNLTFMLVTSWGGFGYNSSGTLPAAEIALRNINSRPDLLPGYNLVYDKIRDSKVSIYTVQLSPACLLAIVKLASKLTRWPEF